MPPNTRAWLIIASAVAAASLWPGAHLSGQQGRSLGCLRFDRAYFQWAGRPVAGGDFVIDSSRIIRLDTMPHRIGFPGEIPPNARVVAVPTMKVDSDATARWQMASFWRTIATDSIELQWHNGLFGPVLRLEVRGDSVRGRVRFLTDRVGVEPRVEPATGSRIACPT
jgi:hypothetical protein